jgi:hypothetical protein
MDPLDVLVDELDKKVTQVQEWLASGQAQDFAGYQKACGEIRGLLIARGYTLDLKHNMEHSDDE